MLPVRGKMPARQSNVARLFRAPDGLLDRGVSECSLRELHELGDAGDGIRPRGQYHAEVTLVATDDALCVEKQPDHGAVDEGALREVDDHVGCSDRRSRQRDSEGFVPARNMDSNRGE